MKKILFLSSLLSILLYQFDGNCAKRDTNNNRSASSSSKLVKVNTGNSNTTNIYTTVSPSTGNKLIQTFNADGTYYWTDIITGEKWITDNQGQFQKYNDLNNEIVPDLGVSLFDAERACKSLKVENFTGKFDPNTKKCLIPVVATNWNGDISKNGQIVMTYTEMGRQFACNKNSFDQVNALRRSSQWVVPVLIAGGTGLGYGIDYAVDKKRNEELQNAELDAELALEYGANKQRLSDEQAIQNINISSVFNGINISNNSFKKLDKTLYFNTANPSNYANGSTLTSNHESQLNSLIDSIKKENSNPKSGDVYIWIIGQASNTNQTGKSDYNDKLAYDRAMAAYNYMKSKFPNVNYEVAYRGARMNTSNDIHNNNASDRVDILSAFVKSDGDNSVLTQVQTRLDSYLKNYKFSSTHFTQSEIDNFGTNNSVPEKDFWSKEGLSGAVIGGGIGTVAAIGFWAAEGASINCNIANLATIKLNKTYDIPSFKEYLIKYGWAHR